MLESNGGAAVLNSMLDAIWAKAIVKTYDKKHDDQDYGANRLYVVFGTRKAFAKRLEKQQRQSNDQACNKAGKAQPQAKPCPIPECVKHVLVPSAGAKRRSRLSITNF